MIEETNTIVYSTIKTLNKYLRYSQWAFISLLVGGILFNIIFNFNLIYSIIYYIIIIILFYIYRFIYEINLSRIIIDKLKIDEINKINNYIRDYIRIKTLDTINLKDIRDESENKFIKDLLDQIKTEEGILLKNQLLKNKNYYDTF